MLKQIQIETWAFNIEYYKNYNRFLQKNTELKIIKL